MTDFKLGALICLVICVAAANAQASNCNVGRVCDMCPEGQYKTVQLGSRTVKVCCSGCNKYLSAGNRADGRAYCTCYFPSDIQGDCWKGEQCQTCLQGANSSYVGSINSIPVCCAQCEKSGLMLGGRLCNCLHNGP